MEEGHHIKPFRDYATHIRETYGERVHRIPLDLGFGCPHRERGNNKTGCIYCSPSGARAVHLAQDMSLDDQVARGIAYVKERYDAAGFIAYCQAFTSTNAPVSLIREKIDHVLSLAPFKALIVGTRPDCLPDETIEYFHELTEKLDVWVELGVQTANDNTLDAIHRGHHFQEVVDACRRLVRKGIHVAAHVILGLPGENREDYKNTAGRLAQLPLSGVKIHNLHVVKDTLLEQCYRDGNVPTMDEHEYGEALMDFLRRIPPHWVVMRMVSDTPTDELVAPQWWMTKGQFIQYIERQMRQRAWNQGDLCGKRRIPGREEATLTRLIPKSSTPGDIPEFRNGAFSQSMKAIDTGTVLSVGTTTVIASGFGNGALALEAIDQLPLHFVDRIHFIGLGISPEPLAEHRRRFPEFAPFLNALEFHRKYHDNRIQAFVHWGDPRKCVFRVRALAELILVELGQIENDVCTATQDYLGRLTGLLAPSGALVSTCSNYAFRGALHRLGLAVAPAGLAVPGGGTIAAFEAGILRNRFTEDEWRILKGTVSGVPFRDPQLIWSRKEILKHRDAVTDRLRKRGWVRRAPTGEDPEATESTVQHNE